MKRVVLTAAVALLAGRASFADISTSEAKRLDDASQVVQQIKSEIPQDYWSRARCVAVIPDLKKAAFIVGGEYGKGVMSCRAGEAWSAPVFMQLAKGSWGFQAGAQEVDLVLLVMNEAGVQKLLDNKVTLGADASVAAGPMGRHASAGTDARLTAEILSYSRAQGLFAGIDLSGGVLRPDEDSNNDVYGSGASPRTILASRAISAPTRAAAFLSALGAANTAGTPGTAGASAASGTSASASSTRATRPLTTTDDDVRAQLTELRQALDRLIADAAPAAGTSGTVGTTGATGSAPAQSGAVVVDRARLVQLRAQVDAAIAALDRR